MEYWVISVIVLAAIILYLAALVKNDPAPAPAPNQILPNKAESNKIALAQWDKSFRDGIRWSKEKALGLFGDDFDMYHKLQRELSSLEKKISWKKYITTEHKEIWERDYRTANTLSGATLGVYYDPCYCADCEVSKVQIELRKTEDLLNKLEDKANNYKKIQHTGEIVL